MSELVLTNGKIYVERDVFAEAVYAEDGVIRMTGSNAEVLAAAGGDAEVIDVEGRTVIPGLNDSHMHLLMVGMGLGRPDTAGVTSIDELVDRVKTFIEEHPEESKNGIMTWIVSPRRFRSCFAGSADMWERPTAR